MSSECFTYKGIKLPNNRQQSSNVNQNYTDTLHIQYNNRFALEAEYEILEFDPIQHLSPLKKNFNHK